jgi:hypothetical protein
MGCQTPGPWEVQPAMTSKFRQYFLVFVGLLELINLCAPLISERFHSDPALSASFMALVGVVLSGKWPGSKDDEGEDGAR